MAKAKRVMLKHTEIEHLLQIIRWNQEDGYYFGRREYFMERQAGIIRKLEAVKHNHVDREGK